jgi:hypothetical protein
MGSRTEVIVKPCRYGCGTLIHFENHNVSNNGRKIPLEGDNTPHDCPFSPYNKKRVQSMDSDLHDMEVIENAKSIFLNTLNRQLSDYVVVDLLIKEKEPKC